MVVDKETNLKRVKPLRDGKMLYVTGDDKGGCLG